MTFYHSSFGEIYKVRTTGWCQALLPDQTGWKECHEYQRGSRISQQQGSIMDGWSAWWLQWWFLLWSLVQRSHTSYTLFLASVLFSKWFLSSWFSTDHTVRQIVYFDFSDSQTHIWKRCYHQIPMSKLSKFRLVGRLGTWQTQSASRSTRLSKPRNIFVCLTKIFLTLNYFAATTCWDNLEAARWEEGGVGSSVNIPVTAWASAQSWSDQTF